MTNYVHNGSCSQETSYALKIILQLYFKQEAKIIFTCLSPSGLYIL